MIVNEAKKKNEIKPTETSIADIHTTTFPAASLSFHFFFQNIQFASQRKHYILMNTGLFGENNSTKY